MLVLNRRPGESIIIEPGLVVTVLSVTDRRVWISFEGPGLPHLRVSAVATGTTAARLEIGPVAAVAYNGDDVSATIGDEGDPSAALHATLAVDRRVGERVTLTGGAWVSVEAVSKGNPCVRFGGPAIGMEFSITLIRPAGNYVRLGVDAPQRRVFRRELWDAVHADGTDGTGPSAAPELATLTTADADRAPATVGASSPTAAGSPG